MTEPTVFAPRTVTLRRTEFSTFEVTNGRGGRIVTGSGDGEMFSPVELLLAGLAGCSAIDIDYITTRRAEPVSFEVVSEGTKVHDHEGNHLTDLSVTFTITFPAGPEGDAARERLPQAIRRSHDSLCTVSRTIEIGAPVAMRAG